MGTCCVSGQMKIHITCNGYGTEDARFRDVAMGVSNRLAEFEEFKPKAGVDIQFTPANGHDKIPDDDLVVIRYSKDLTGEEMVYLQKIMEIIRNLGRHDQLVPCFVPR
jgi:hypothetical protein